MKQSFHSHGLLIFLLLIFLLFSYSTTNARLLMPKQGEEKINVHGLPQMGPLVEIEQEDSSNIMGLEHCEKGDEECLKRRMMAEAHLDYIYTQHHKP